MSMVSDRRGRERPMDRMLRFIKGNDHVAVLFEGEETTAEVSHAEFDRAFDRWTKFMLPAPAGTYLIREFSDVEGEEEPYYRVHVLAWAHLHDGTVYPVTVEGVTSDFVALLLPDGRVEQPYDRSLDDYASFVEDRPKQRAEAAAARAHFAALERERGGTSPEAS